jgi:hypothetical protein
MQYACTEGTETNLGIKALEPYGLDIIDKAYMPTWGLQFLAILCNSAIAQLVVDQSSLESRTATWELLRSWGIGCTPGRLELRASDVWRMFEDDMVLMDKKTPMISLEAITFLLGDKEDIVDDWPAHEVPTYETLEERRTHIFTFMHLCLRFKHELFLRLWKSVAGAPPSKVDTERFMERFMEKSRALNLKQEAEPNTLTLMDIHTAKLIKEEQQAETRRGKARRARKKRSERKRLARELIERNADVDDVACVVCLDEPSVVRFGPCQHVCCCAECAEMLEKCCLCRQVIGTREVVEHVSDTVDPVEGKDKGKGKAKATAAQGPKTRQQVIMDALGKKYATMQGTKDFMYDLLLGVEQPWESKTDKNGKPLKRTRERVGFPSPW